MNQREQVAAATSQKTAFFIVTAAKTSNLTFCIYSLSEKAAGFDQFLV
jgi:hypothetical protein